MFLQDLFTGIGDLFSPLTGLLEAILSIFGGLFGGLGI